MRNWQLLHSAVALRFKLQCLQCFDHGLKWDEGLSQDYYQLLKEGLELFELIFILKNNMQNSQ